MKFKHGTRRHVSQPAGVPPEWLLDGRLPPEE